MIIQSSLFGFAVLLLEWKARECEISTDLQDVELENKLTMSAHPVTNMLMENIFLCTDTNLFAEINKVQEIQILGEKIYGK